jgi:hypothetical protein
MVKIWELQTGEEITVEPEGGKTKKERAEEEQLFYHVLFYMFMELCISS